MRARRCLTAGALALTLLSAAPLGPTAEAATVSASSCSQTVEGIPGQRVVLDPVSVTEPIVRALAPLDPLGVLTRGFREAWAGQAPIVVGTVPETSSEVGGGQIADAVIARLGQIPVLAPVFQTLASSLRGALASVCTLVLRALPAPLPVPLPAPGSPAPAPGKPGGSGSTPVGPSGGGAVPVPVGGEGSSPSLGSGAVFGSRLPDLMPGGALFPALGPGVPGAPGSGGSPQPTVVRAPQSVGSAEALPTKHDTLSPAVLTALLLLSVVSAQLVRRWVLGPRPRRR